MQFVCRNVFDLLTELAESKSHPYDFIILDPPAFTKSSATVKNAERGYRDINLRAMRALPRGGYLATCSCSHFMTDELFCKMLVRAARDARGVFEADRGPAAGPRPPRFVERARDRLFEVLPVSGGVRGLAKEQAFAAP